MIKKVINCLFLLLFLSLHGCDMISAGSGSLKSYNFETTKAKLEVAVMKVIADNKNIYRKAEISQEYKDVYKEFAKERNKEHKNDQIDTNCVDDYYNDGKTYLTIYSKEKNYEFTFRYYGDEKEWKTSPRSEFFLVYAYDKYKKGGGYNNKLDAAFLKQLTDTFELEFVDKVATELGIEYKNTSNE